MKHLKLLLLISALLLCGCSSNEDNPASYEVASVPTETPTPTPTPEPTATPKPTAIPTEAPKVSELFTTVYLPYANREKPWLFNSVKNFCEASSYSCEVTEPTEDIVGTIQVFDSNGDYVYFLFMPSAVGDDIIMTVGFHQEASNSEVSLSNYSSNSSAEYDTLSTHIIGGQENDVLSVDEQQSFLFN